MGKRREKNKLVKGNYIDAAQRVFIRHGYRGATTAQIAVEAGLSEGNLYRHFKSKHDLLVKIMHRIYDLYKDMLEEALEKVDEPLEVVEAIFKAHADFIRKYPLEAQIITRVCPFLIGEKDIPCKAIFAEQKKMVNTKLEESIDKGVQEGRFTDLNPKDTAQVISFMLHGYMYQQVFSRDPKAGALKGKRLAVDFCKKTLGED